MLENQLLHSAHKAIAPENQKTIVAQITERLKDTANEEFLEELRAKVRENEFAFVVTSRSDETLRRIYRETDSLTRRGTLNLVLGVVTSSFWYRVTFLGRPWRDTPHGHISGFHHSLSSPSFYRRDD